MTDGGPTIGELSRQVSGALIRMEATVSKLETQYVSRELFNLWQNTTDNRLRQLEDNNKWLVRLVIGFVIAGILGALFTLSGGGK